MREFATFIPATRHGQRKFLLDMDSVCLDDDESLLFPQGTPKKVILEFMEFLTEQVGPVRFTVPYIEGDCHYVSFDPSLSPELQGKIQACIRNLTNSAQ